MAPRASRTNPVVDLDFKSDSMRGRLSHGYRGIRQRQGMRHSIPRNVFDVAAPLIEGVHLV
jgi:hypothetical protein